MFDNIKFFILDKDRFEESMSKSDKIDLTTSLNIKTGVIEDYPKRGQLVNLDVRITPTQAYIVGSIHKFFNQFLTGEEHNYNDFTYTDNVDVIDYICNYSGIKPEQTKITNLEFGFNLEVDEDPQIIVDRNVLLFDFKSHNRNKKYKGKGDFKEFQRTDYLFKVYNKSKQYGTQNHILRLELKITSSRILERFGIFNLNDLKDKSKIELLFRFFLQKFEKLLIIDDYNENRKIPERVKDKLNSYTNPVFWQTHFEGKSDSIKRMHLRNFQELIEKYKLDSVKKELGKKLGQKYEELIGS